MESNLEVLILAGGLGTRLQSVTSAPKCLAPVNDKPFLNYIFDYLISQNITRINISVGYKSGEVKSTYGNQYKNIALNYIEETEPLGTGGAIKFAFEQTAADAFIVMNGDTFFPLSIAGFIQHHHTTASDCSLALKKMQQFNRYGSVDINEEKRIIAFHEKKEMAEGLINAGTYIINRNALLPSIDERKFSLEKDFFEPFTTRLKFTGFVSDTYFIDIGIAEDYYKAQHEFKTLEY